MAPILDLGTEPGIGAWSGEDTAEARREMWKEWMRK